MRQGSASGEAGCVPARVATPVTPSWLAGPPLPTPILRGLVILTLVLGGVYLSWRLTASINWPFWPLAVLLLAAEFSSFVGAALFAVTAWRWRAPRPGPPPRGDESVDVFITCYDEPVAVVRETVTAALAIRFPHHTYVLDDGARPEIREMTLAAGAGYLVRSDDWLGRPRHAKAGNLTNALRQTTGEFILVLDADQVPAPAILDHTLGWFRNPAVAVAQTPQWFRNVPAHDPFGSQARLFYGPIQQGKAGWDAAFFCGSNAVLRREALMQTGLVEFAAAERRQLRAALVRAARLAQRAHRAGGGRVAIRCRQHIGLALAALDRGQPLQPLVTGLRELARDPLSSALPPPALAELRQALSALTLGRLDEAVAVFPIATSSLTEDMATTVRLHALGWRTVYIPRILATGLAPADLGSALRQRQRWAEGTLQVLLAERPLTRRGLRPGQRLMYLATIWSYLAGFATVIYLLAPVLFLLGGISPLRAESGDFLTRFLPYLIISQVLLGVMSWGLPSWRARQYGMALFPVQIRAVANAIASHYRGRRLPFVVTPKRPVAGTSWRLIWPQLLAMGLLALALAKGATDLLLGGSLDAGAVIGNMAWAAYDLAALSVVIVGWRASPTLRRSPAARRVRGPWPVAEVTPRPLEPATVLVEA